ncbi:alpha/beta hydrolase [Streptomyces sp. RB6PN25]|uniref:Alpha/beta hydrolase n=1 Tax=Streptomyces humicola TaxID=2953240 RepID=A0ABT1PRD3_9ACTN|nr:alpha/beta fold hydrolase [Streptomyces humicola]MCQ4080226.1 alpha/beta hydrolase [Streptomyces humicola]
MSRPPTLVLPDAALAYALETSRGAFAVLDAGRPLRGTALLVPGFTGSKEDFIALLEPLADAGWRVVAIDGRGQYESEGPHDEKAYAQAELAADVIAQAEAVGDGGPVHLLGHSFGGLVARAAVLRDAAHDASLWASLTLMSSGPAAIDASQQVRTQLLTDALAANGNDMESVWQQMRRLDAEDLDTRTSPDAIDEFLHRRWLATVPEQLTATGRQLVSEPDRVAELAAVVLPKLVMSGEVDYAWPTPWLDSMAEELSARREVIGGAEHSPNAEQPEATAAVLDNFWGTSR